MSAGSHNPERGTTFAPGAKVEHPDLGEGVVLALEPSGFARVFFRDLGERQVSISALRDAKSWISQVIGGLRRSKPRNSLSSRAPRP